MANLARRVKAFIKDQQYIHLSKKTLLLIMLFAGLGFSAMSALTWEVTNSSDFCGSVCHLMEPQTVTFEQSAHAEVDCTNCHLGIGVSPELVMRKATELTQVYKNLTGSYELPLRIKYLRPARETCEKCHWTKAFYDDKVKLLKHYNEDQESSLVKTALIMKIGGGTQRDGKGYGIHWHVENKVEYLATDSLKQEIPWVRVTDLAGNKVIYQEKGSDIQTEDINQSDLRTMDCIDCHNRASHSFPNPDKALDEALAAGKISSQIPWIKKNFLALLQRRDLNDEEFTKAVKQLRKSYLQQYPDINQRELNQALAELERIYQETVYEDMEINWRTYPSSMGHKDFPGCFRCHDGKHITQSTEVSVERKVIRKECNLCHSVPLQSENGNVDSIQVLNKVLQPPDEPDSHLTAGWGDKHGGDKDESCFNCHETEQESAEQFCSNTGCHGTRWDLPKVARFYAGNEIYCIECHQIADSGDHGVASHQIECISCHNQIDWQIRQESCESCHRLNQHQPVQNRACWNCHDFTEKQGKES